MSNIDLTITDQTPISLEITTSNVEVINNTTLEFNPTQDVVSLEIYPSVIYSVTTGGGGGGSGVSSISNAQGTATGDVFLTGTNVKITKSGNTFAFNVDPTASFYNATMEQLTAGNGLCGGTITTIGTISADFGTTANKIMEGNDSRVTGLKSMAYQESSNINVTGGNIKDVYTVFNGYTHSKVNEAQFVYVSNKTGSTINKGIVVYVEGALGDVLKIAPAQADAEATSSNVLGLVSEDIADNDFGYVMVKGEFVGVRTNNIGSEGDTVYLSETDAGGMRTGIPQAPNHGVRIGVIVKSAGPGAGIIQVDVDNYQELSELSDVHISGITTGHTIQWNGTNSRWENQFGFRFIEGRTFTSSETYTIPTGAKIIFGQCIGAGGGGAAGGKTGQTPLTGGGGGGGGAYYEFFDDVSTYAAGATVTVTIGSGGVGGIDSASSSLHNGGDGGFSRFDTFYFPGAQGGGLSSARSIGYSTTGIVRNNTFSNHLAGIGGALRANTNNPGFAGTRGYRGAAGGGGGGAMTTAAGSYGGGQGGQATNDASVALTSTLAQFNTAGATSGAGGGGNGAIVSGSIPAVAGFDGNVLFGGGGGGGGNSVRNGAVDGNGATGGYPGGGGGGGGANQGNTANAGGAGGNARIMIWVYGN